MSNRVELLTPVGRLVQGSLYEPNTTDAENKPLTYRNGPNAGQPRVDYFFALAIPKKNETHWNQTEWGAKIYEVAKAGFPNGAYNSPSFAWKIKDGDSVIPNRNGKRPCDQDGFPGHWVLIFNSAFAPTLYNEDGTKQLTEPKAVNTGDYIQVYGNIADNESQQQPGVFLNHSMVSLQRYGERIFSGADPKSVGFGKDVTFPMGASTTPLPQGFNPAPPTGTPIPSGQPAPVVPYPQILTPPIPPTPPVGRTVASLPIRVMTEKAQGLSYEQYIQAGWTDELLIQNGIMQA